jgi:hypothetical protein
MANTPEPAAPAFQFHIPLRTTGSQLQCIVRDILRNNFLKFNAHCRLKVE